MNTILYTYENLIYNGKLIKRPSASVKSPYIADIYIEDTNVLAHCPSLGVSGLLNDTCDFICSKNMDPKRKSNYTIELIYLPSTKNIVTLTNTNPQFGNKIFNNILKNNLIDVYKNNKIIKSEKKYKDSRFDFYVKKENNKEEFIEIKSVVLCDFEKNDYPNTIKKPEINTNIDYKKAAIFPDGFRKNKNVPISERAIKHLETLEDCVNNGYDASLYFIIQRDDCDYFKPSNIDEFYYNALKKAHTNGVNIKAIKVMWSNEGICTYKGFVDVII
jgi:sugar fermentation stimulation protein A